MEESRSSSPEAPPEDLWSSILDSVSSRRSTPEKHVLLLGDPSTGKSTIASALLQKDLADIKDQSNDFALGYDWANVRDEGDEDTLARLSVYTVPSSADAHLSLVPHFLPPKSSLQHTVAVIVLDWTRPWSFMERLQVWLQWIDKWLQMDASRDMDIIREESRERLQYHLQHYSEPSAEPVAATSTLTSTLLPLAPGVFTLNTSGLPIVVVCNKADLIDDGHDLIGAATSGLGGGMVKGKGSELEERTDGIMQVLRTICLIYGAALFYTSLLPTSLQVLRQYILHLLFIPAAPSPGTTAASDSALQRNPFPFDHKPNVLDRDRLFVPAGWDSWGKIAILRDGFDSQLWRSAWENDVDSKPGEFTDSGARAMFSTMAPDQSIRPTPFPPFINPTPEQAFLAKHHDENSKKGDKDPRGAFRNPSESSVSAAAGIVGPLGSSSFNLPTVERALVEMEGGPSMSAESRRTVTAPRPAASRPANLAPGTSHRPSSVSPSSPSPTGQTQHEVLQNFFQSLLSNKDRTNASGAVSRTAGTSASVASTNQEDVQSINGAESPNLDESSS